MDATPTNGRIRLREWHSNDLDAMHQWIGDPRVTRFLNWGAASKLESQRHLDVCLSSQSESPRVRFYFAIEHVADSIVIGDAGFQWTGNDRGKRIAEMGYFIQADYWGKGLGAEAATLVLAYAFTTENADEVQASCLAANVWSERVMINSGMSLCAKSTDGARRCYRITRGDWSN